MTIIYIIPSILGAIIALGTGFYLKYFIPLRPKESGFEYVYVYEDGTVSELNEEDKEYLMTEFSPADGARPYIKTRYNERTPDNKISGFILRRRVPKRITIKPFEENLEKRTISWIYLAVSMASETQPANLKEISTIADGINHSVPTNKELQDSISWLLERGLINKEGKKYSLTPKGKDDFKKASENSNTVLKNWDNLEFSIEKYA